MHHENRDICRIFKNIIKWIKWSFKRLTRSVKKKEKLILYVNDKNLGK